jgi:drug/metabolite transporter (DMT)-like permease
LPLEALGLALAAAFSHAGGNVLVGRTRDPEAATAVLLAVAVVVFAPVAAATWHVHAAAAPWMVASAALELGYFILLAAGYRRHDVSLVYPIARGVAPVLVLVIGVAALGRGTSAEQAAGVCAIAFGVLLVRGLGAGRADLGGVALALATSACIAGYTLVDKEGLRHASPLPYIEVVLVVPAMLYSAAMLRIKGRANVRAEVRPPLIAASLVLFVTYVLVLAALKLASAASVAAVRETSVVIATALAAVVLREPVGRARLAGAALVAGGVALVALG